MTGAKPLTLTARIRSLFPPGQVLRYVIVGAVNTVLGYSLYAAVFYLLNRVTPPHWQYLTVIAATLLATPVSITVSYLNYKFFVFQTRGNYVREWIRAFGVYGVSMLPGLLALSALTRVLQVVLHGRAPFGSGTPGYLAGALITLFSSSIGFIGHKKVTFKAPVPPVTAAVDSAEAP